MRVHYLKHRWGGGGVARILVGKLDASNSEMEFINVQSRGNLGVLEQRGVNKQHWLIMIDNVAL